MDWWKRLTTVISLCAMLVGCGTPAYMTRIQTLNNSGQCAAAESEVNANEHEPGRRAMWLGGIAHDCRRDEQAAIRYFTLSARYGNSFAQEQLAKLNQPVPPADLKGRNTDCVILRGYVTCTSN